MILLVWNMQNATATTGDQKVGELRRIVEEKPDETYLICCTEVRASARPEAEAWAQQLSANLQGGNRRFLCEVTPMHGPTEVQKEYCVVLFSDDIKPEAVQYDKWCSRFDSTEDANKLTYIQGQRQGRTHSMLSRASTSADTTRSIDAHVASHKKSSDLRRPILITFQGAQVVGGGVLIVHAPGPQQKAQDNNILAEQYADALAAETEQDHDIVIIAGDFNVYGSMTFPGFVEADTGGSTRRSSGGVSRSRLDRFYHRIGWLHEHDVTVDIREGVNHSDHFPVGVHIPLGGANRRRAGGVMRGGDGNRRRHRSPYYRL